MIVVEVLGALHDLRQLFLLEELDLEAGNLLQKGMNLSSSSQGGDTECPRGSH